MLITFYLAGLVALVATIMVISRTNAMHAMLYLVVALLALAVDFYLLGAPFIAALEVIVYAGAIVVLFVFAVMLLNLGQAAEAEEGHWLPPRAWLGPCALGLLLLGELVYLLTRTEEALRVQPVTAKQVSQVLFGPYLIGVELASFLLLAGLVAAYHLGHTAKE